MSILFRLSKGKGILILLYLIVCLIGTSMLIGILNRNIGGVFKRFDFYTTAGVAFHYRDKEGSKKKMDTVNSFGFISMRTWSFIFFGAGTVLLGNLLFHYFSASTN
jgi:hypothetical protein